MLYQVKEPEVWTDVVGIPAYSVSSLGRVRNKRFGRIVTPKSGDRYLYFAYGLGPKTRSKRVHRAVVESFLGPPPFHMAHTRHLDGNPLNNKLSNLIWGTASENNADRKRHGTHDGGVQNSRSRFTVEQVREIRMAPKVRGMPGKLAKKFGVSASAVRNVILGTRYKDVV